MTGLTEQTALHTFNKSAVNQNGAIVFDLSAAAREFYQNFPNMTAVDFHPLRAYPAFFPRDTEKRFLGMCTSYNGWRKIFVQENSGEELLATFPRPPTGFYGVARPETKAVFTEKKLFHTFDHETAHLFDSSLFKIPPRSNFAEAFCDTYATLMSIKRFGLDRRFLENHCINQFLFSLRYKEHVPLHHFTAPAVIAALDWACDKDLGAMRPQDLLDAAHIIARKHALSPQVLDKAEEQLFGPIRSYDAQNAEGRLQKAAETVLECNSPEAFEWGAWFLKRALDKDFALADIDGAPISIDAPYWDGIRAQLAEKMAAHRADPVFMGRFNAPAAAAKPLRPI